MKKNVLVLLLVIVPIAVGAVIMSYGADMVIDGIGLLIMLIGCGIGASRIIKRKLKDVKTPFWAPLICTCLSVVCLGIAGRIHFSGSVILALLGAVLLAVASVIEYRHL